MEKWLQELIDSYGWFYTANFNCTAMPNGVDIHTHGLFEKYDHHDLQVCLPVTYDELETVSGLFRLIIDEIDKGRRFEPGLPYMGLLPEPYTLTFATAIVGGKRYYRLLYPDTNGLLNEFPYATQLQQLTDYEPLLPVYFEPSDLDNIGDVAQFILAINTCYDIIYCPGIDFLSHPMPVEKGPLTENMAARLSNMIDRCQQVCAGKYDLGKIALKMETVRQAMMPEAWEIKIDIG